MEFFKSVIQIPDLPDVGVMNFHAHLSRGFLSITFCLLLSLASQEPPNFLRAAALAEYKKPVVVMPGEDYQEEEVETHPEFRETPQMPQVRLNMPEMKGFTPQPC